jgi:putative exosortase-associated protein (TIGR04073 family)
MRLAALAVALVLVGQGTVGAVRLQIEPEEELPRPTGFEKSLTKLGRGLSNIMLGWAEIPVTFDRKYRHEGKPLAYLLGVVPVLGTARAVLRTSTGLFEVTTFPFTDRTINYEAMLEPEYIF